MKALQYVVLVLALGLTLITSATFAARQGELTGTCSFFETPGVACTGNYSAPDDFSSLSTFMTYTKTYPLGQVPRSVKVLKAAGGSVGASYGYQNGEACTVPFTVNGTTTTYESFSWQASTVILSDGEAQSQQILAQRGRTDSGYDYNGDGVVSTSDWHFWKNNVPSVQVQFSVSCWHARPVAPQTEPLTQTEVLSQSDWSVHGVDSEEMLNVNREAGRAFDGNTATIWHTQWKDADPTHPHYVDIDLGAAYTLSGVRYLPRQSGVNGQVADYAVYVSADGVNWGAAVATGTFPAGTAEQEVLFAETTGQYIRFEALSEVNGGPWTSVAELNVLHEVFVLNVGGFQ